MGIRNHDTNVTEIIVHNKAQYKKSCSLENAFVCLLYMYIYVYICTYTGLSKKTGTIFARLNFITY